MTSIQEAFGSIGLEKYVDAFVSAGFNSFEDFFGLGPGELETLLNDIGMLKGHTFKLKKMIEDGKAGIMPKAKAPGMNVSNSVLSNSLSFAPPKPALPMSTPQKPASSQEPNYTKDLIDKANTVKSQLSTILQSKESLISSLKQLVELDLEVYFQALDNLKTMQTSIKGLLHCDVEMNI